jgi:hypothetical protein
VRGFEVPIGEDADDLDAPLDLAVEALNNRPWAHAQAWIKKLDDLLVLF